MTKKPDLFTPPLPPIPGSVGLIAGMIDRCVQYFCEGNMTTLFDPHTKARRADPRDIFDIRDERWTHGLLAVLFALLAFQIGAWRETDTALSAARQKFAEWAQHERIKIADEEMKNARALLEKQWPCVAWGPDIENLKCIIRELRP